jgi:N-hydroxyarylamine O-acetyltransferase
MTLPSPIVSAYLGRLRLSSLSGEPPSVEGLAALAEAHVRRVPWETVWIHERLDWGIAPTTSAARIATGRRGGYCYHLNGAFSALLTALGYDVTRHVAGVHGPDGPSADMLSNHMALVVTLDDAPIYVDVGLGDALWTPVPLAAASITQEPFSLTLSTVEPGGVGDWHLAHDPRGAFVGMSIIGDPASSMDAFAERHEWLSTSSDSNFVKLLVIQRRTADAVEGLRGLVHTVLTASDTVTTVVDDRAAWLDLLDDFGIVLRDPDALWGRVVRAHEEKMASS